ncbi:MAG: DNA repair protein RadA [Microthrixaceae bacterium]
MSRSRTVFRCESCGSEQPQWAGQCAGCGEWNTLSESVARVSAPNSATPLRRHRESMPITEVPQVDSGALPTGVGELDRVLGGGLVRGSVTLLGGEPGVGKSTLALQLVAEGVRRGRRCTYVTGEESPQQVAARATRLDALESGIELVPETVVDRLVERLEVDSPDVCVVDSVQTLYDPSVGSVPGSVTQIRDCTQRLVSLAKDRGITMVLVGHVTKEGTIAGPRVLEHLVDTVLTLDGDRHGELRILRASKHRFGSTQEIGLFAMGERGMESVADPSALFLADRQPGISGSVVVPALEGQRPLLVEVQSLVTSSALAQPRRSAQGLDGGRLNLLLAVLSRRAQITTAGLDVYAMAVGGVKVSEPGVDLALCAAIASAVNNRAAAEGLVLFGEVGLGGELRRVARMGQRLGEAARHGFRTAVVPASAPRSHPDIEVIGVPSLDHALDVAGVI